MTEPENPIRYGVEHDYNNVKFRLEDFTPDNEESRILIMKVVEQAVRDYLLLYNSEFANEKEAWETAHDFLYDDEYRLEWGTWTLSPEELLEIINMDIHYIREQIAKRFAAKKELDNAQKA